jgi:hypothetical protein
MVVLCTAFGIVVLLSATSGARFISGIEGTGVHVAGIGGTDSAVAGIGGTDSAIAGISGPGANGIA